MIAGLGGTVVTWPLTTRAQTAGAMRRIGVFMNIGADGLEPATRLKAFTERLQQLGWVEGQNVQIDVRWGAGDADLVRKYSAELLAPTPDAVVASGTLIVGALQRVSRTVPIVFVLVSDPVGAGLVDNLARPGGNATGFMLYEYTLSAKWLELLREITPGVKRVAVIRDSANPAGTAQFGVIQGAALSLGIEVSPVNVRDGQEIERAVAAFARTANGGLIVTGSGTATVHRDLFIALAARHKLPAVYTNRFDVIAGGLMSYGPDRINQYQRAAEYVDRILKGAKPGDLPVQAPTKYELYLNAKTAKALGADIPVSLRARADEVIE